MRLSEWLSLAGSVFALAACERPPPATAQGLHNRAAFELGCSEVGLVRIDEATAGVWGCGRRVIYVEACDEDHCRWVIEREVPPPSVAFPYPRLPERPAIVRKPDEWRARVPALIDDDPGF